MNGLKDGTEATIWAAAYLFPRGVTGYQKAASSNPRDRRLDKKFGARKISKHFFVKVSGDE
jgi:hypothetical protein